MAKLDIVTVPDYRLRLTSRPIREVTDEIKQFAEDMAETMYANNGIGLAAIQVGKPVRLIVIDLTETEEKPEYMALINPEIVENSGSIKFEEGCLSIPGVTAEIERFNKVVVEYLNLEGEPEAIEAEGLLAVVLQHEIDHTMGKLFVDYLPPKQRAKLLQASKEYQRERKLKKGKLEPQNDKGKVI